MQPIVQERELSTRGAASSAKFTISSKGTAHIMRILRDTLYSDKILAVIREYSSNAWDAQRAAGKGDQPIKVNFPTSLEPTLSIRDYGHGLSEEDVYNLYIQYGESTKRDSNEEVGFLGIGNKSGFAYSDSFSIVSYHKGVKTIYVANLDPTDEGVLSKFHSEPCGDETGMEIQIPVLEKDIAAFKERGQRLLSYFNPPPVTNIPIESCNWKEHPLGILQERYSNKYIAVMGCIPYRFDPAQVTSTTEDAHVREFLSCNPVVIPLEIGAADISASREELKYSDLTKSAIQNAVRKLLDNIISEAVSVLEDPASTGLAKRRAFGAVWRASSNAATDLGQRLLPEMFRSELCFNLEPTFKSSAISYLKTPRNSYDLLSLEKRRTRHHNPEFLYTNRLPRALYLKDVRTHKNRVFDTSSEIVIVNPRPRVKIDDVRKELETHLKELYIDGLPIELVSSLPLMNTKKAESQKHSKQNAVLLKYNRGRDTKVPSSNWDEVPHTPGEEDVYVMLDAFQCSFGGDSFTDCYPTDEAVLKYFGISMPPVWGYRTVKGVKSMEPVGTAYPVWRRTMFAKIFDDAMKRKVDMIRLKSRVEGYYVPATTLQKLAPAARKSLSKGHKILECIEAFDEALKFQITDTERSAVLKISMQLGYNDKGTMIFETFSKSLREYPLASHHDFFSRFDNYLEYIEAMDLLRSSQQKVSGFSN